MRNTEWGTPIADYRNNIFFILIFSCLFISSPLFAFSYQPIEKGLEYGVYIPKDSDLFKLHLFKINLHHFKVIPLLARDHRTSALTAKSFVTRSGALMCLNANFFDETNRPLGAVLKEGRLIFPPKQNSWWAALLLKGDDGKIEKTATKNEFLKFKNGLQAGPRLVVQGRPLKLKPEISPKTAVGFDKSGNFFLIISEGSIEINQLAKILSKPRKNGGIGLLTALNLDGGSSTQLYAKMGGFELWIPGLTKVPVALGVFKR